LSLFGLKEGTVPPESPEPDPAEPIVPPPDDDPPRPKNKMDWNKFASPDRGLMGIRDGIGVGPIQSDVPHPKKRSGIPSDIPEFRPVTKRNQEWFIQQALFACAGLFEKALITVEEDGITVKAYDDNTKCLFLVATFPPVEGVETTGWDNIKAKTFDLIPAGRAAQPTILSIPWEHTLKVGQIETLIKYKTVSRFATIALEETPNLTYSLPWVAKILKKKPLLWQCSSTEGLLKASVERDDGVSFDYIIRGQPR
jgi:hypothetical protein